jgi:hypothetical protein
MSNMSERSEAGHPLDALEALYAARPSRASERPEPPRLAAVNELAALARAGKPETVRPIAPLSERIENLLPESARRRIEPEAVPEPEDFKSEGLRRKLFAGLIGVAATLAAASVVALLLVNIFPKDKDADQSAAAAPPPQSHQVDAASKAPLSRVSAPVATDSGQDFDHEQSERLLQQFMQWRQKAASTDKP